MGRKNSLGSAPDMWLQAQGGQPHFFFGLASASLSLCLILFSSFSSLKSSLKIG
jgi:hypothetical protein